MITSSSDSVVERLSVYHCRAALISPLMLSSGLIGHRDVLLLRWQIDGNTYWSEVAPLPGYSRESLNQCLSQIKKHLVPLLPAKFDVVLKQGQRCLPAVSFSVGALLLLLRNNPEPADVKVCRLVSSGASLEDSLSGIERLKVKVGSQSLSRDILRVRMLCARADFTGRIRLDANQQWSVEDIQRLQGQIDPERIEWLEEPLSQSSSYDKWLSFSAIPFALDENLYQTEREPRYDKGLKALILKPMLLGYKRTVALHRWAKQNRCRVVISSSFETGVGLGLLRRMAALIAPDECHGLDTLKYLPEEYGYTEPDTNTQQLELII